MILEKNAATYLCCVEERGLQISVRQRFQRDNELQVMWCVWWGLTLFFTFRLTLNKRKKETAPFLPRYLKIV